MIDQPLDRFGLCHSVLGVKSVSCIGACCAVCSDVCGFDVSVVGGTSSKQVVMLGIGDLRSNEECPFKKFNHLNRTFQALHLL